MSWLSNKEPFGSNLTSKPHSPLSPNTVRVKNYSYNPNDRIGKGYSSIVYKGVNEHTNETIAIKCIDMKGIKDSISR
jgi:serine/threonine-protein kinase ULK/ATG1